MKKPTAYDGKGKYAFVSYSHNVFKSNEERTALSTGFANSQGAVKGACSWWLRTLGKTNSNAMYVDVKGKPVTFGMSVENNHVAVRPAFYIEL